MKELNNYLVELKKLKKLDKNSKEYKKCFKYLRKKVDVTLVNNLLNAKEGEKAFEFRKKYFRSFFLSIIFLFLLLALYFFGSDITNLEDYSKIELFCFFLYLIGILLFAYLSIYNSNKVTKTRDEYLTYLIENTKRK